MKDASKQIFYWNNPIRITSLPSVHLLAPKWNHINYFFAIVPI